MPRKRKDSERRAFVGRGSPVGFGYLAIGFLVFRSFLHAMQYSPDSSWNVIVAPAPHQGHVMVSQCLMTRMLVVRPGRRPALPATIVLSMVRRRGLYLYLPKCSHRFLYPFM